MHLLLHSNSLSSFPPLLLGTCRYFIIISVLFVRVHHYRHGEYGMLFVHFIRSTLTRDTSFGANYTGIYSIGIHM